MLARAALRKRQNKGAIVPLVAICLIPLMFALAMAVDVGYMYVVQAELQAAADAAALAAAGEMSGASTSVYLQQATAAAKLYANQHSSLGMATNLVLADEDIEFGDATYDSSTSRWEFVANPSSEAPYAVRVTVRRNGDQNPAVPRFFSRVLGANSGTQSASAVAMIAPRDIALVVDLSQSMTFDSMLIHRNDTQINLRDVWVTLGGVANSPHTKEVDGQQFITDYELHTPSSSIYASQTGPTFGSMTVWGTEILQNGYNETEVAADPGMYFLPELGSTPSGGWTTTLGGTSDPRYIWLVTSTSNPTSLVSRGHSVNERTKLLQKPSSESDTSYRNRVKVVLGLATWTDSDGDDFPDNSEISTNVAEPYVQGEGWDKWIDDVRNASGLTYSSTWGGASYFRYRYGLKSYVNWLMDCQFAKDSPVSGSTGYTPALQRTVAEPLQALKDAVQEFTDYLEEVEANDKVGLVVYGTNGAEDPYSATNGLTNNYDVIADLPYPHQAGEHGRFTNTGEALLRGYKMVHGPGSRPYAHKVIVFMSDGNTTAYNGFDVIEDLEDPGNIAMLQAVQDLDDFDDLFGGIPSGTVTTGGNDTPTATAGRDETLAIGEILVSNHLGMGDVELNVVGVGADADMENLLIPLAAANGGEAYYAEPDLNDPQALPNLLKEIYKKIGGRRPVALISQ
jgi:Flp pilus assembly protein TadG